MVAWWSGRGSRPSTKVANQVTKTIAPSPPVAKLASIRAGSARKNRKNTFARLRGPWSSCTSMTYPAWSSKEKGG